MVFAGRPGPLSLIEISPGAVDTLITISGAMPASSQASIALSTSSFRMQSGQSMGWWPVCAVSSFTEQNSSNREVRNVSRCRRGAAARTSAFMLLEPHRPSAIAFLAPVAPASASGPLLFCDIVRLPCRSAVIRHFVDRRLPAAGLPSMWLPTSVGKDRAGREPECPSAQSIHRGFGEGRAGSGWWANEWRRRLAGLKTFPRIPAEGSGAAHQSHAAIYAP